MLWWRCNYINYGSRTGAAHFLSSVLCLFAARLHGEELDVKIQWRIQGEIPGYLPFQSIAMWL